MAQWTEIGKSGLTGAVAGAVDQIVINQDEKSKRTEAAAGKTLSIWRQISTYYNYMLPLGIVVACAADAVKGAWADRLVTVAGQLAGRKAIAQVTKVSQSAPWRPYVPRAPSPQTTFPDYADVKIS